MGREYPLLLFRPGVEYAKFTYFQAKILGQRVRTSVTAALNYIQSNTCVNFIQSSTAANRVKVAQSLVISMKVLGVQRERLLLKRRNDRRRTDSFSWTGL